MTTSQGYMLRGEDSVIAYVYAQKNIRIFFFFQKLFFLKVKTIYL